MQGFIFEFMEKYDYENLFLCQEQSLGLKAIIAIHDTTLGPAAGGTRMWTYDSENEAIKDALRLARGMTYKYAASGANLGGGKCVVIGDPKRDKTEAMFRALGRFIHRLNGLYLTGEDVGTTLREMEIMRMETPYVLTLPQAWGGAGDIAPATAFGVLQAMRACLKEVFGSDSLQGRKVAVQGAGAVGKNAIKQLVEAGAIVTIADIDKEKVASLAAQYGVSVASPEEIHRLDVEVFCPCALGAVLNDQTLDELRCKIVCGSANNQLAEDKHGDLIDVRGILYAPDYIANAGGTLFDTDRIDPGGFNQMRAMDKVSRIYETMEKLLGICKDQKIPTYKAADILAEQRIASMRHAKSLVTAGTVRM